MRDTVFLLLLLCLFLLESVNAHAQTPRETGFGHKYLKVPTRQLRINEARSHLAARTKWPKTQMHFADILKFLRSRGLDVFTNGKMLAEYVGVKPDLKITLPGHSDRLDRLLDDLMVRLRQMKLKPGKDRPLVWGLDEGVLVITLSSLWDRLHADRLGHQSDVRLMTLPSQKQAFKQMLKPIALKAERMNLSAVFQQIQEKTGQKIVVNWAELNWNCGIEKDLKIDLSLSGGGLQLLTYVMWQASRKTDAIKDLHWHINEHGHVIVNAE